MVTVVTAPGEVPIPEYSTREEAQEVRTHRHVSVGDGEHVIDMTLVEPYRNIIQHAGMVTPLTIPPPHYPAPSLSRPLTTPPPHYPAPHYHAPSLSRPLTTPPPHSCSLTITSPHYILPPHYPAPSGYVGEERLAVMVVSSCYLPPRSLHNYKQIAQELF